MLDAVLRDAPASILRQVPKGLGRKAIRRVYSLGRSMVDVARWLGESAVRHFRSMC
jgi:hypothetical protein